MKSLTCVALSVASLLIGTVARGEEAACTVYERFIERDTDHCSKGDGDYAETVRATVDLAKVARIASVGVGAQKTERTKIARQELDPNLYTWSEVEYRYCLAFESCRIDRATYQVLLAEGRSLYRDAPTLKRVQSVLKERRASYTSQRFVVSAHRTATVGKVMLGGAGRRFEDVSASCPEYADKDSVAELDGYGDCRGLTQTPNGARAVVSQTGEGESFCTITLSCRLSPTEIDSRMSEDEAFLREAQSDEIETRIQSLRAIRYPRQETVE